MEQVGIWTAAQFTKLEGLIEEADALSKKRGRARDGLDLDCHSFRSSSFKDMTGTFSQPSQIQAETP